MNKEDIINYVTQTPYNSNKKVLDDMLDTLIEENSNSALIVPFTRVSDNTYSFPYDMRNEILTALYEGRKVISSGLDNYNGPYEATMCDDEYISFQKIFMIGNILHFNYIDYHSSGKSVLNEYVVTTTAAS